MGLQHTNAFMTWKRHLIPSNIQFFSITSTSLESMGRPGDSSDPSTTILVDRSGSAVSYQELSLQRGVRQGSVLSPMLFLMVMDSLLKDLAIEMAGISIEGMYAGSLCHADDLRSVTSNLQSLEKQAEIVKSFTERNSLTLNESKLEILKFLFYQCL